jgi:hypothetical protein
MANKASVLAKKLGVTGYYFNGGELMSQGWKLGLSLAGWILLYGIMYAVMRSVASLIPFIGPLVFGLIVGPSLSAGLILFIHKKYTTGQSDFGTIFKGFKFIGPLIVNILLIGLIMIGVFIPIGFLAFFAVGAESFIEFGQSIKDMPPSTNPMDIFYFFLNFIKVILPAVLILVFGISLASTFFIFSTHFIVLTKCSATEAIASSFNIVKKKLFPIFGILFLLGLIEVISIIPLGLGLIVTIPWILGTVYMIFNSTILSRLEGDEDNNVSSDDLLDA